MSPYTVVLQSLLADMQAQPSAVVESTPAPYVPLHIHYFALLRSNRNFRHLWLAQLISEIGDWFYSLAIFDLLLRLTQRAQSVSWAVIVETLLWFLLTPLAGPIVDRFHRRSLMILADAARGLIVLGPILVHGANLVWLIYSFLALEVVFASIFEPARSALLPDIVSEGQLLHANALASATWALALTIGAALGGAATALLGRDPAFVIDSLSFFASALLVRKLRTKESHMEKTSSARQAELESSTLGSLRQVRDYLRSEPRILVLVFGKMGLGMMAGSLVLLTVFGERVFDFPGRAALAMGLLFAARGVGAGLGPILGDRFTKSSEPRMWKSIGFCYMLSGLTYIAFSRAPSLPLALLALLIAYSGMSTNWVMTTTLLQLHSKEGLRGRIFALDFGIMMLMVALSNYLIGRALDVWHFTPRDCAAGLGAAVLLTGVLWLGTRSQWSKPVAPPERVAI